MNRPRIGDLQLDNPLILAPLAGVTDLAFRTIVRRYGASLAFTEMVSSIALDYDSTGATELLRTNESDRPLGVQIFGSDPDSIARAVEAVQPISDIVDINFGCPARKVVSEPTPAGAGLLKYPDRIARIIRAAVAASDVPVTIKIRSGWSEDDINAVEIAQIGESEGIAAITVHPRTRQQHFKGRADWNVIREVKENVSLTVIGNGDVREPEDAIRLIAETGCDAVMIGRGSLGNPWIFARTLAVMRGEPEIPEPSLEERFGVLTELMGMMTAFKGEERASREIRKHVVWFCRGLPNAKAIKLNLAQIHSRSDLQALLDRYREYHPQLV